MTTIAVKDGKMASYSQASRGDTISQKRVRKIHKINDNYVGFSGCMHDIVIFIKHMKGGIDKVPDHLDCVGLIMPRKGKPRTVSTSEGVVVEREVPHTFALGPGSGVAMAAMAAGASAREAVEVATKLDVWSGGEGVEVSRKNL